MLPCRASWAMRSSSCKLHFSLKAVRAIHQDRASRNRPFVISVEGNIGSGKSTFLSYLVPYSDVEVVTEPLHLWKNVGGHNALELLYQDPARWGFLFNAYAQLTRADLHCKATVKPVKVLERSVYSTRLCFVENAFRRYAVVAWHECDQIGDELVMCHVLGTQSQLGGAVQFPMPWSSSLSGTLNAMEYDVLTQWFDWLIANKDLHLDLIVYLQADPKNCYSRLKLRDRQEETTIPLSYLECLHALHEEWLINPKHSVSIPTMVIDANCSLEEFQQQCEYKLVKVLGDFIGPGVSVGTPV